MCKNMASLAEQFLNDVGSDSEEESQSDASSASEKNESPTVAPSPIPASLSDELDSLKAQVLALTPTPTDISAEYPLVIRCAAIIADIDHQVRSIHSLLLVAYKPRFPELETLIFNPLDYARVARLAANQKDLKSLDLSSILPSGTVITLQLTASTSSGRLLTPPELTKVYSLCDALTRLDEWRFFLLQHVERRARFMAPNLVAIVGGAVAAKLMGLAGGLKPLAQMPSCNLKVMGKQPKSLQGTSSATTRLHEGVIFTCPLVTNLPKQHRSKAGDVVSGKACLAARVDACRESRDGAIGKGLRHTLEEKFAKWQEPPPAKTAKPLPIPGDETKRRHRGGQRARKEKERLGITDVRRLANRLKFGEEEQTIGNNLESEGFGMLGKEGSGKLRIRSKKTDTVSVAAKRRLAKQQKREGKSEAEILGITSRSELSNQTDLLGVIFAPESASADTKKADEKEAKSTYFSASTPFLGVEKRDRKISKTSHKDKDTK